DGGGIRGLSELFILKAIMQAIQRSTGAEHEPKPCEVFDLICGSSSRLRMSVDDSIQAFIEMSEKIFSRANRWPMDLRGRLKPRYSSEALKSAFTLVLLRVGLAENELLAEQEGTFSTIAIVATRTTDSSIALMSSDPSQNIIISDKITIQEAAMATSAAPVYFEPVQLEPGGWIFVDGGVGANNPVQYALSTAMSKWPERSVSCLLSIGSGQSAPAITGLSNGMGMLDYVTFITKVVTETERTAASFMLHNRGMIDANNYFRFNVKPGLENVSFDEYRATQLVEVATRVYLDSPLQRVELEACVKR
ncbi:FabD/lysophospholipase-like protein, partial [Polyplosphaeria fusca]